MLEKPQRKDYFEHEKQKHFTVFIIQINSVNLTFYQDIQWFFTFAKILALFITSDIILNMNCEIYAFYAFLFLQCKEKVVYILRENLKRKFDFR